MARKVDERTKEVAKKVDESRKEAVKRFDEAEKKLDTIIGLEKPFNKEEE